MESLLPKRLQDAMNRMGFAGLTEVQKRSVPVAMEGKDVQVMARTGSGKTLAFLLPAVDLLLRKKERKHAHVLVISPTRELAMQSAKVAEALGDHAGAGISVALLVGGTKKSAEMKRLEQGCDIIVATPGRLLDHLRAGLKLHKVKMAVLDESDRILDSGFEREMGRVLKYIPEKRQTLIFSATATANCLLDTWMKKGFVQIAVDRERTNEGLVQSYVLCPESKRFSLLFSFLRKYRDQKVIVFFSTCNSVVFHSEIFCLLGFSIETLHGGMKQEKRSRVFEELSRSEKGILFSTDVSARGLDFPGVAWILQYDPPADPKEYIHRVGRTARAGASGKALLMLLPHEQVFVRYLQKIGVVVEAWGFNEPRDVGMPFVAAVQGNYYLEKSAREALKSYLHAYAGHKLKKIFNAEKIELNGLSRSFGFEKMPRIELSIGFSGKEKIEKA
jgi:ATP-dependent RNA helicase DDX18/HAS1